MKVLFMDIDGVLNSERTVYASKRFPKSFKHTDAFDWVAVGMLRRLCADYDVKIVLSSTWRAYYSAGEVADGLNLPVVSQTPLLYEPRGVEIQKWLEDHPEVTKYAIVDDNGDMLTEQLPFFVQTDMRMGLSYDNLRQLRELLV